MDKVCSRCNKTKSLDDFHYQASGKFGRRSQCKECRKPPPKEWASGFRTCASCLARKEKTDFPLDSRGTPRKYCKSCRYRFDAYGLDKSDIDEMMLNQNSTCGICPGDISNGRFAVDHDHKCCSTRRTCGKCVRGLLCVMCNTRLGWIEDHLESANNYLRKYV